MGLSLSFGKKLGNKLDGNQMPISSMLFQKHKPTNTNWDRIYQYMILTILWQLIIYKYYELLPREILTWRKLKQGQIKFWIMDCILYQKAQGHTTSVMYSETNCTREEIQANVKWIDNLCFYALKCWNALSQLKLEGQ